MSVAPPPWLAQLPVAAMALWRLGAVYLPLFTAFAGPSAALRVRAAGA